MGTTDSGTATMRPGSPDRTTTAACADQSTDADRPARRGGAGPGTAVIRTRPVQLYKEPRLPGEGDVLS